MPRRIEETFRNSALDELSRQMLFAPPDRRVEQVRRAEALHDQIDPERNYPLDFVMYRITGYHSESETDEGTLMVGESLRPDLRLLIDRVSRSVGIPTREDESVETLEELATRLDVSTKTIQRWRKSGLRWRWIPNEDSRNKVVLGFTRQAVDHFIADHEERVRKASQFTQMTDEDREALLRRAQRIAQATDVAPSHLIRHLAKRTGRAVETIRLLFEKHDRQHPDDPIFADRTGALSPEHRHEIVEAYREGERVQSLCRRFDRTRSTIYRAIHEQRALSLQDRARGYVELPVFARDDADEVILRPLPDPGINLSSRATQPSLRDLHVPEIVTDLFDHRRLPAEQQQQLLIRMHYLRFKAKRGCDALDPYAPRTRDMNSIESWLDAADAVRNDLVIANLSVVMEVAIKHLLTTDEDLHSLSMLYDMLEAGLALLIKTVDEQKPGAEPSLDQRLRWQLMRRFAVLTTEATEQADQGHAKAKRKRQPEALVEHLIDQAKEQGVEIPVPAAMLEGE